MSTWLGVDPGEKRIGVARSDPLGLLAHPAGTAPDTARLLALIQEVTDGRPLAGVVVGLPRNMDGSIGPSARRALGLVKRLRRELTGVPVYAWDERLTTRQASRLPRRGARPLDEQAAALILQSYLDAGRPVAPDPSEILDTPEA